MALYKLDVKATLRYKRKELVSANEIRRHLFDRSAKLYRNYRSIRVNVCQRLQFLNLGIYE